MNKAQYQQIKKLISEYLDSPEQERQAFLYRTANQHPELIDTLKGIIKFEATESVLDELPIQINHDSGIEQPPLNEEDQNKYQLLHKLNAGGFSHVYHAVQRTPAKRDVAIKFLNRLPNPTLLAAEVGFLALLNHPNIATLFEMGETTDQRFFIVMELIDGTDLITYAHDNQLTLKDKVKLFQQLCLGISHAHEKGIIHCDIKPSNVLVTDVDGEATVKVIDFGVSKYQQLQQEASEVTGTPAFMAPESIENKQLMIDTRQDVYSMGMLLHKLLFGVMPGEMQNQKTAINKDLQAIIHRATHVDRDVRYANSKELHDDLNRYLNKEVVSARKPSIGYVLGRYLIRNKGTTLAIMAVLISVLGGYYAQAIQSKAAKNAQKEAETTAAFVIDLFSAANPEAAKEDQLSTVELVNQAKTNLLEIPEPSTTDAKFMHTLSDIFSRMDQMEDASLMAVKAYEIELKSYGEEAPQLIDNLTQQGVIYRKLRRYDEAENALLKALELMDNQIYPDATQLSYVHNHLGNLFHSIKETDLSIQHHLQALKYRREQGEMKLVADSLINLGAQYRAKKKWQKSAEYFTQAQQLYESEYGLNHPYVFYVKNNMSYVKEQTFDWSESERLMTETLAGFKKIYGDGHSNTQVVRKNLAKFYARMQQYEDSIHIYQQLIELYEKKSDTYNHARYLAYLGKAYTQANQNQQSLLVHQKAIELARSVEPVDHVLLTLVYKDFAFSLLKQKSYIEAESMIQNSMDHVSQFGQNKFFYNISVLNEYAEILLAAGKPEQAIKYFQDAVDAEGENTTIKKTKMVTGYLGLAKSQHLLGQFEQAVVNYQQALNLNQSIYGELHKINGKILYHMGSLYSENNQPSIAKEYFDQAWESHHVTLPPGHSDLVLTTTARNKIK